MRIDRFARTWCTPTTAPSMRYDRLILATGSRSFFPPMEGMWADDKTLTSGVFGFRSLDDCAAMIDYAAGRTKAVSSAAACSAWRPRAACRAGA